MFYLRKCIVWKDYFQNSFKSFLLLKLVKFMGQLFFSVLQ